jgi:hypothetical protein
VSGSIVIRDTAGSSSVPPRREKEEPEEEWEEIPPELIKETRPWWVEHRKLQANLSCHPDDPADAPSQTLVVMHSLAGMGAAAGGATGGQPLFDLVSDSDEDVRPKVKTEDGGAGRSSGGGRYCGGRRGGGRGRNGGH